MKRNRVYFVLTLLFLSFLLFAGCKKSSDDEKIYLSENWSYTLDEDGKSGWKPLPVENLTNLPPLLDTGIGYIWLKNTVRIPYGAAAKDLSVYLGRISMADETYFNGSLIGTGGYFPPEEWSSWNKVRLYNIPGGIIKSGEANELTIKIWLNGEGSVVAKPFPYIGDSYEAEHTYKRERFWNGTVYALCAFALLVIAAYHILIFAKRPEDRENILFAFINIVTALYLCVFYIDDLPDLPFKGLNFLTFQKIFSYSLPFLLIYFVGSFVQVFLGAKDVRLVKIARRILVLIPVAVLFVAPDYPVLRKLWGICQIMLLPHIVYIAIVMVRSLKKGKNEVVPLFIGFSPFLLAIVLDLIHNLLHWYALPYISMYGWMLVIIMLLFILASKFTAARNEAEDLNANLEKKVEDRTRELSETNALLESANRQAADDMKLAVYVQQSFYPRVAPVTGDYDVAFTFNPKAGVSGDLFDFYKVGNRLAGAALFDVSGHGIAAGLVTMLAKSIISKEFVDNMNKPLANVMSIISNKIAEDKGDVENYLTGILLRFENEYAYYVNGGHPAMFFRNSSGKVSMAAIAGKEKEASGGLVGIKNLPVEYTGIKFKMSPGDAILIYTDCLYETKDVNGIEFGTDRIPQAFEHAAGHSAQEKLNQVLGEFKEFAEGSEIKDDLTMIVIQKR